MLKFLLNLKLTTFIFYFLFFIGLCNFIKWLIKVLIIYPKKLKEGTHWDTNNSPIFKEIIEDEKPLKIVENKEEFKEKPKKQIKNNKKKVNNKEEDNDDILNISSLIENNALAELSNEEDEKEEED